MLWLIVQSITLAIGAARLPLTAHAGPVPRQSALAEMIVVQLVVAAVGFPTILQSRPLAAWCSAAIFLQLAALLDYPTRSLSALFLPLLWLTAMALLSPLAVSQFAQTLIRLALVFLFVIFPVTTYLRADFSDAPIHSSGWLGKFDALSQCLMGTEGTAARKAALILPISLVVASIAVRIKEKWRAGTNSVESVG